MGLKSTLDWAKNEWGIFARRDQMSLDESVRWLRQWVPFGTRTVIFGSVSCAGGPFDPRVSAWCQRQWSQSSMRGLGITAEVSGGEHVPEGAVMYASNHQSLLDILVLGATLPGDIKWATKRSIMNVPFLGWHLRLAGHVPVDRDAGSRAAAETIERFREKLVAGERLLVFPEGTRSPDGEVQGFKNGGFYAAVRAGVPVVPVALDGTFFMMRKHAADTGDTADRGEWDKRHVRVKIGRPIQPPSEGKERARVERLRDETRAAVVALHGELRTLTPWRKQAAPVADGAAPAAPHGD